MISKASHQLIFRGSHYCSLKSVFLHHARASEHAAIRGFLSLHFCISPLRAGAKGFLRGFRGRKAQVSPL
ncbi:hypothetical protein [Helicobacter sp. 12S02634-8]|uniref:hypothetical protein n=1 Tax=Helicobacter sp. 12S02634-8 TaxID=1476199 RepID=UPI00117A1F02|nr:hypothetical protein [Helicobacter sp. 12S02634-8]